jgi:hypothetical protein
VGPEAYIIFGALFKNKNTKLQIKISYESEYLLKMRNEITTNYKFKKAGNYHKNHKSRKIT